VTPRVGLITAVVGLVLALLAALADPLGYGGSSGFGGRQIAGVVVGLIVMVVGLALMARSRRGPRGSAPPAP
jgi:hypothetical protein